MLTVAEIRSRALAFANEWAGETRESAERQTFWNEWFEIFGIRRRRLVAFEHHVKKLGGASGFVDVFWPGKVLAEHKSAGEDLDAAMVQAEGYLAGLSEVELPRLIIISDFVKFRVRDLDAGANYAFKLDELADSIELFTFLAGYRPRVFSEQHDVDASAAELMGQIHDALAASGYRDHNLRVLLVRLLFILFADDSGVWETGIFEEYLEQKTATSGHDLGMHLAQIFQTLDTREEDRQNLLDTSLKQFPYINGQLFSETLPLASFSQEIRETILHASRFNWSAISPAVFGSMFQSVMKPDERRNVGAHYTSEQNILKTIEPLFLDQLRDELERCRSDRHRLEAFHNKLASLKFFDPACGCGNFLIIAYREIRKLELDVLLRLRELDKRLAPGQLAIDATELSKVTVDHFYGIEYDEFPARIAEVAMYLMDHLANQQLSKSFGMYYVRFPLQAPANIRVGNALRISWHDLIPRDECSYILGNPPFVAKKRRSGQQADDMRLIFNDAKGHGELDYVAAWFEKASDYIGDTSIGVAFVSTNSIVQGEQVAALWPRLLERGIVLDFAHRTFKWTNEARGKAAVHVVIIGMSIGGNGRDRLIFDYESPTSPPQERRVSAINAYLTDGPNVIVRSRRRPLDSGTRIIRFGSMPNDGGGLILSPEVFDEVRAQDPVAAKYTRQLLGSDGLFDGKIRHCLWLPDAKPSDVNGSPFLKDRIARVFQHRNKSTRPATKKLASTPTLFGEIRQPESRYLCVPRHSSESRRYVPMVFTEPTVIAHDSTLTISDANDYEFGVLHSAMWMAWLRSVGGRIKSDYRISAELVYNTFPWPLETTKPARARVESIAQEIQDIRQEHDDSTLDVVYHPQSMPPKLVKAHERLDSAVDKLYGRARFNELTRVARLLELYAARVN